MLQKNLKPMLYLGAALLVIVAAVFSGTGKKTPAKRAQLGIRRRSRSPGQHGQQRAGSEEPGRSGQQQSSATAARVDSTRRLPMRRPRSKPRLPHYGPTGQPVPCAPGQPCACRRQHISSSSHPRSRKSSSLRPKTANLPTILASRRILSSRERPDIHHLAIRSCGATKQPTSDTRKLLRRPVRTAAVSSRRAPRAIRLPCSLRKTPAQHRAGDQYRRSHGTALCGL